MSVLTATRTLTLEELVVDAWEGLAAADVVACPVCGGQMAPLPRSGEHRAPHGSCLDCGAELA
jgi:hypothetical protein